jgi:hypothetical protein
MLEAWDLLGGDAAPRVSDIYVRQRRSSHLSTYVCVPFCTVSHDALSHTLPRSKTLLYVHN